MPELRAGVPGGLQPGQQPARGDLPELQDEFPSSEVRNTFCTCFPSWPPVLFGGGDNRVIVNKFMWDYPDDGLARLFYQRRPARVLAAETLGRDRLPLSGGEPATAGPAARIYRTCGWIRT